MPGQIVRTTVWWLYSWQLRDTSQQLRSLDGTDCRYRMNIHFHCHRQSSVALHHPVSVWNFHSMLKNCRPVMYHQPSYWHLGRHRHRCPTAETPYRRRRSPMPTSDRYLPYLRQNDRSGCRHHCLGPRLWVSHLCCCADQRDLAALRWWPPAGNWDQQRVRMQFATHTPAAVSPTCLSRLRCRHMHSAAERSFCTTTQQLFILTANMLNYYYCC